jgi:hypothetical protein
MFDVENSNLTTAQPPETFKLIVDAIEDPIGEYICFCSCKLAGISS